MTQTKPNTNPRILLLSGYDAASHIQWRNSLIQNMPMFQWHVLSLPPRHFQWRIRGNALSWLDHPYMKESWDLIIATSMVDLASVKGFHPNLANVPCIYYVHENQFAFPLSRQQQANVEPQMVNIFSALSADCILFNSQWNQQSFMQGVTALLQKLPDHVPQGVPQRLLSKSQVLPVPVADELFTSKRDGYNWSCPHIVWNHRWEYDKGPERLLALLRALKQNNVNFRLSVVGEQFRKWPHAFDEIKHEFSAVIENWGFMESRQAYNQLLKEADIVLSTALHDFQGLAMLEAMASGCIPLAPNRLAYPEYVAAECLYESHEENIELEAQAACRQLLAMLNRHQTHTAPKDWSMSALIPQYELIFNQTIYRPA